MRAILVALMMLTVAASACGRERWPVKIGADPHAAQVDLQPKAAAIGQLGALPAPRDPDRYFNERFPGEFQAYRIRGRLTLIKHEADGDYHMVVTARDGAHMIVESPDPKCAMHSVWHGQILAVRNAIDRHLGKIRSGKHHPNVWVEVVGVLFFDKIHGQEGRASNGVELHPLLRIRFLRGPP